MTSSSTTNATIETTVTFPTKRYTWDQLKHIIMTEKDLALLRRSKEQQVEYEEFRSQLRQNWKSVLDYILCTKFHWDQERCCHPNITQNNNISSTTTNKGGLWQAIPPSSNDISKAPQMVLYLNDFPYFMDHNIDHWILWKLDWNADHPNNNNHDASSKTTITNDEIEEAKLNLCQQNTNVIETLHWINPPHLKSLPEIDHVHILTLSTTTCKENNCKT